MSTDLDICNDALILIGEDIIATLTDNTDQALTVNQLYPRVRDAVLAAHPWHFATKRVSLVRHAVAPVFGWDFQYILPTDMLRLIEFAGDAMSWVDGSGGWSDIFMIESGMLLTNSTSAFIRYVWANYLPGTYDPLFVAALTARLASEIAQPLTSNEALQTRMWNTYQAKLAEAEQIDGQQQTPQSLHNDELTRVR